MEDKKMPLNKVEQAALKEGGKMGVDLDGAATLGGVQFYNVAVDVPKGDLSLLEKVMEGANSKVDERLPVEERKGGAGNLGKMFYSVGEDKLAIMCHVPKIGIHKKLSLEDWVMAVAASIAPVTIVEVGESSPKLKPVRWTSTASGPR